MATTLPLCIVSPGLFIYFAMFVWAFPRGIVTFAFPEHGSPLGALAAGWLFYIALTFIGFCQKRKVGYFIVYTILRLLLILNPVGCNMEVNNMKWSHI